MKAHVRYAPQGEGDEGISACFESPLEVLHANTMDAVRPLLRTVHERSLQGRWCVGYVSYEAAPAFDKALAVHAPDCRLASFGIYEAAGAPRNEAPVGDAPLSATWQRTLNQEGFDNAVAAIHGSIGSGDAYQLNYTAPLHGQLVSGHHRALFDAMVAAQPAKYCTYIQDGDDFILSVSPELFFDWRAGAMVTRPMKGTAPRGYTDAEEAVNRQYLRTSPKERAENVMIVDLLRNDLSRIALPGSVRADKLFAIEALPTVLQMTSEVSAATRPDVTLETVFEALFPCGSVTGAPKVQAMRLLHALEPQPRGVYCGAVGVVRPGGHATFSVPIRTVQAKGRALRCGFGSGITWDARSAGEWDEWQHKSAFLRRASAPFELLETLRLDAGQMVDLQRHVARMARAAQHFGFPFDEVQLRQTLEPVSRAHPQGTHRVRLLLDAGGRYAVECFALPDLALPVQVRLADTPLEAADGEFVRFKTTRRDHYNAFAPTDAACFDTLLFNARGELTEGTRSNVALKIGGRWLTPALSCGLLDGIARERFLAQGQMVEALIRREDIVNASDIAVFNALRGWCPATLLA